MQTPQYFIDSDLSLFYYTTPRSIVQLFKENQTTATGRLVFDYLMLNYSRKLNHTHKIIEGFRLNNDTGFRLVSDF